MGGCLLACGREDLAEDEGRQGRRGGAHGRCRCGAEEERLLQVRGPDEHEAEEQAGDEGSKGRESLHQGALRLQGEAGIEDRARPCDEEAQDDALKPDEGAESLSCSEWYAPLVKDNQIRAVRS